MFCILNVLLRIPQRDKYHFKNWTMLEERKKKIFCSNSLRFINSRHLFGVEADFIGSGQRGFYPLVSDQSSQDVSEHVDPGLRTQSYLPGHTAVRDQHVQREAHFVRLVCPANQREERWKRSVLYKATSIRIIIIYM